MRIGKYGNADSGRGPDSPIKIGEPEIALAYCTYVAVDSLQNRLYLADSGNQRIVNVGLSYHAEQLAPLAEGDGSTGRDTQKGSRTAGSGVGIDGRTGGR